MKNKRNLNHDFLKIQIFCLARKHALIIKNYNMYKCIKVLTT